MGDEYPGVHRLGMSGQRPSGLEVTWHCTSFTSVTPVTRAACLAPPLCPQRADVNRARGASRPRRATTGPVPSPRRPAEDAARDADLMRRISAGDRSAVDALYARFRRPAYALARRILADETMAEDVLQEVFLSVWRD